VSTEVGTRARQVRSSRGFKALVVTGLVSYGLVHLALAWIAVQVAMGGKGGDASNQGALRGLAGQPLGAVLLWIMAVGLFALVVWEVMDAAFARGQGAAEWRRRARYLGRAIVHLAVGVLAVRVAMGSSERSSEQAEETLSARLLALPAGRLLVFAVAAGILAVGISLIRKGVKQKFREDLDQSVARSVEAAGTVGYVAKGIALAIIAVLFAWSAATADPDKAGGLDAALSTVRDQPFGTVLLVAMAVGIACFGAFCLAWARYARV
jgi:hypothetical protein